MKTLKNLWVVCLLMAVPVHAEAITHSFLVTGGQTYIIEFSPEEKSDAAVSAAKPNIVFADFESESYTGWTAEGTAFGDGPVVVGKMPAYQGQVGAIGERLVNTHNARNGEEVGAADKHTGSLTSDSFSIARRYVSFRIGGGAHAGKTCINLIIDGKVVRTEAGHNANAMRDAAWDVREFAGKQATLQIRDDVAGGWGNIGIDHIVFTDEKPNALKSAGRITWRYPASTRDGYVLPNGKILLTLSARHPKYPGGAVIEVTRDGEETLRHKGTQSEVNSAQPLPDGGLVVTEAGPKPRLIEYDKAGKVVVEFPLACQLGNHHMQTRMARKLKDGTYLVPHLLDFAVKQYDRTGKVLQTIDTAIAGDPERDIHSWPFTAIRLPNGNTLVGLTHSHRVAEFDADGKKVWELTNDDLPAEYQIRDACGIQRLPNGNTVITSYAAGAAGTKLMEVTPDKKVVWSYKNAAAQGIHHFQILDTNGVALKDSPLK